METRTIQTLKVGLLSEQDLDHPDISLVDVASDLHWELCHINRRSADTCADQLATADAKLQAAEASDEAAQQSINWFVDQLETHLPAFCHIAELKPGYWSVNPDVQDAIEQADLVVNDNDRFANVVMPKRFTGLFVHVNDHGNVHCANYRNGEEVLEHWSVV